MNTDSSPFVLETVAYISACLPTPSSFTCILCIVPFVCLSVFLSRFSVFIDVDAGGEWLGSGWLHLTYTVHVDSLPDHNVVK
jgi:hypothetical protein